VPVLRSAKVEIGASLALPAPALALLVDEYREQTAALSSDGTVRAVGTHDGKLAGQAQLVPPELGASLAGSTTQGRPGFAAATADGRVLVMPMSWDATFDAQQKRSLAPRFGEVQTVGGGEA